MEQTDELTALIAAGEEILRGEEAEQTRKDYEAEREVQRLRIQEQERRARAMAMTMPPVFLSHLGEQEDVARSVYDESLARFRVEIILPDCVVFWAHFKDLEKTGWVLDDYELPQLFVPQDYPFDDIDQLGFFPNDEDDNKYSSNRFDDIDQLGFFPNGKHTDNAQKAAALAARLNQEYRLAMESYTQWLTRQAQPEPTYIPADLADNPNVDALIASMRQFVRAEIDLSSNSGR